jgi:hypothetical protein
MSQEELRIFVERFMHFMNLWTVYSDFLSGRYVPSVNSDDGHNESILSVQITLMFMLYAFFYSVVEDSQDALNGFRVWRERFPEEEHAIAAVERQVIPFRDRLRVFRNRLGFHGSRTRTHEADGLELFAAHTGDQIFQAMANFKSLGAALLAKANAEQGLPNPSHEQARLWIDAVAARAQRR